MNKLTPIDYIENSLSYQPKIILSWVTEGIVINNTRYSIKEFRLKEDGKLYAVIAENKYDSGYFEVQLAPDEETLKDIYQAIKENKISIEKEVTDRKSEITRVDTAIKANNTKIEQEIADRKSEIDHVDGKIGANTAKIDKEITDRKNEISRVDGKVTELQNNIKPIVSDDSGLLAVTTENSQIKLTPKHDDQKQNKLDSNTSIGLSGSGLRQLYINKQTYTASNCVLKTHVKTLSQNTSITRVDDEFNFIVKINKGATSASFTLNEHDKSKFQNIITAYGVDSSVRINGCLFSLNGTTLTVSTEANTGSNYVMSFSDII